MKKIFTLLMTFIITSVAMSQSTTVVISQFYPGGGATSGTPTYKYDYVELHNISNTVQDISGFSLQYGSSTGNFGSSASNIYVFPANTLIPAGGYLLVQLSSAGTVGADLPVQPDLTTTNLTMSATNGKVALANQSTSLACGATATTCTLPYAAIIDLVSWGTANNAEGGAAVNGGTSLDNTKGGVRKNSGCQDTDNNNSDFDVVTAPVPRNLSSAAVNCTTLPVKLASFNAAATNNTVALNWNTASEENVHSFNVERSIDGKSFEAIASVAAKNSANGAAYTYNDVLRAGVTYYRLKMVDKDGSFAFSKVVSVNGKAVASIDVYPNPVRDRFVISHPKTFNGATVDIFTLNGKKVMSQNAAFNAEQTTVDAAKLVAGTYIVVLNNGEQTLTTKLVKL